MQPVFDDIHHIAIISSDYAKARHFYVDILGMSIIRENRRAEKNDIKLDLRLNDTTELEIFIKPDAHQRVSNPEALGLRHLAFHTDNIENMIDYLKSYNVTIENIRTDDYTGEKMVFFFDPDGLPLELHE